MHSKDSPAQATSATPSTILTEANIDRIRALAVDARDNPATWDHDDCPMLALFANVLPSEIVALCDARTDLDSDLFKDRVLAQQVVWSRLTAEVSASAVASMMLGDHSAAAEGFARCERLVLMIQESKRWRRIHEQGAPGDE